MSTMHQPELQQRTLRLYGELLCRRANWGHQLCVAAFPRSAASGLAAAASLAGAASLTVDKDAGDMKAHFRDGAFDFVVNTLDEALRALKNEVRKGRPIAIGLIADPGAVLAEAVERGLAAQMIVTDALEPPALDQGIAEPESIVLRTSEPSMRLKEWLDGKHWKAGALEEPVNPATFEKGDPRYQWLRNLPAHQRSVMLGPRWSWVTNAS